MASSSTSPFTLKGILVGALFSFLMGVGAPYAVIMLQGSFMAINSSSPGAIFLFFVLVFFINGFLFFIRRQFALSRADLVMIYIMLLIASAVPTQAFVGYLIPVISGLYYYATPENNWAEIFFPYVTEWLAPQDYKAVKDLHEGLPPGEAIPWGAWQETLGFWYVFFLVLSFMMICMSVILHRQWSRHERLAYPMVQLPMQMLEEREGPLGRLRPFFRSRAMWCGFAVPFCLFGLTGINHYIPLVPDVPFFLGSFRLFRDTTYLPFAFSYAWVGFFYLVDLNITFSIWFFFLLSKVQEGAFSMVGIASTEQLSLYSFSQTADLTHQSMGACVVFVLYTLWVGRQHLRDVWRKAWSGDEGVDDGDEVLPYRVAVFGFAASLLFIGAWLWASGIPLLVLPMFLASCLIFYILVSRVVAAAGVATARSPMVAAFVVISGLGTSVIGAKGLVALTFTYIWQSEMRLFPMIACANSLKLAELIPGPKRRLFWAMVVALLCSLAGATWIILTLCYEHGGINLHPFFMTSQAVRTFRDMAQPLLNPTPPDMRGWMFTGVGGLIEGVLMWGQHRFYWWRLHPLGYVISVGWLTGQIWFSVFVSWLLKLLIMKYGGARLFARAKPFFLGLILGEATAGGFWLVVDWILGETGNMITVM
ncbi:MAG: hypothetical protein GKR89_19945 [Candidatus Latescibacteria bacterium]|nr:hypothetical protein [Candidatus Latescibacterota bacterium]